MTSTGTEHRSDPIRCGLKPGFRAIAAFLATAVIVFSAGCSSDSVAAPRSVSIPGWAPAGAEANLGRPSPDSRIIRVEPDAERDAQIEPLLKSALDALRSGEIQTALDELAMAQGIEGWMRSEHAPAVLFWTGHAYDQLNERHAATAAFRRITIQYPRSAFADRAARRLRELRSRPPSNP